MRARLDPRLRGDDGIQGTGARFADKEPFRIAELL